MRRLIPLVIAIVLLPAAVRSQGEEAASGSYKPSLGDLMTMTAQPRHLKLGLGGQERNWAYAAYELHELEESLERIAKIVPKWREVPIAENIIATHTLPFAIRSIGAVLKVRTKRRTGRMRSTAARMSAGSIFTGSLPILCSTCTYSTPSWAVLKFWA